MMCILEVLELVFDIFRFCCFLVIVCGYKYFDYVVLFFILISCVMLVLEEFNILLNNKVINF